MHIGSLLGLSSQSLCRQACIRFSSTPIQRGLGLTTSRWVGTLTNEAPLIPRTRNIGIIAHIDAGKTTTTERMLYYSGFTRRIGDVDDGSTVTDFLPAERARGITIQSAAITFHWPPSSSAAHVTTPKGTLTNDTYTINLIDTPGHADFTFEVVRSLRILDGAVCILDGVAGVEAQTEKVWSQAQSYKIPTIIYVNKLDRDGAAFGRTVRDIARKLRSWPAVCQIPWFENVVGRFQGVVDIVSLKALRWAEGGDGSSIQVLNLDELGHIDPNLAKEAQKARIALVELLSEHDDIMIEKYLECEENHLEISAADITSSLRKCLLDTKSNIVPVFAGASFRNIGVQPILDAIISFLPDPNETPDSEFQTATMRGSIRSLASGRLPVANNHDLADVRKSPASKKSRVMGLQSLEACALAFKVVNDAKRGMLVYVRTYHGNLQRGSTIFNTNLQISERVPRLLQMYANDAVEISSIAAGQIGVITGLKYARTGDTLISYMGINPKNGPFNDIQLRPIDVPPPVFFASIEPRSLAEQKSVADALEVLLREDPSLHITTDQDSGQTHLSGMGELHLEIARDRLMDELKAKATMGKIEIGYRERLSADMDSEHYVFDREIAGKIAKASCTASITAISRLFPSNEYTDTTATLVRDGNVINTSFIKSEDHEISLTNLLPPHLTPEVVHRALQNGVIAALARGPMHAFPMHDTMVSIDLDPVKDIFGTDSTPAALSSAARLATQAVLKKSALSEPTTLMEPVMNVKICLDEASLGAVIHDLSSSRGGHIVSLDEPDETSSQEADARSDITHLDLKRIYSPPDRFESKYTSAKEELDMGGVNNRQRTITARVPLREMVGYLKHLRSHTGGRGAFVMSVDCFEKMSRQRERIVLKDLRGI